MIPFYAPLCVGKWLSLRRDPINIGLIVCTDTIFSAPPPSSLFDYLFLCWQVAFASPRSYQCLLTQSPKSPHLDPTSTLGAGHLDVVWRHGGVSPARTGRNRGAATLPQLRTTLKPHVVSRQAARHTVMPGARVIGSRAQGPSSHVRASAVDGPGPPNPLSSRNAAVLFSFYTQLHDDGYQKDTMSELLRYLWLFCPLRVCRATLDRYLGNSAASQLCPVAALQYSTPFLT